MYGYSSADMGRAFRTVRKNTIQTAEDIPEDQYDFRPGEGAMSVADSLRHVAVSTSWAVEAHGARLTNLTFDMFREGMAKRKVEEAALHTKSDILKALNNEGEVFATFLEGLTDEVLAEKVSFPPETNQAPKTRFEMLLSQKEHEMHHRAQLMVVERMLGIVPHLTRQRQEHMAAEKPRTQGAS